MPLGVERDELYHAAPVRLAPGDTLLLMTDGLTEARPPMTMGRRADDIELLGHEGIARIAVAALGGAAATAAGEEATASAPPLGDAAEAILAAARDFNGGKPWRDDVCMMLARLQ
jgi:serine phosphatase RsbU (regulator of sigma subunit)